MSYVDIDYMVGYDELVEDLKNGKPIEFELDDFSVRYVPERTCEGCKHFTLNKNPPLICETCSQSWADHFEQKVVE